MTAAGLRSESERTDARAPSALTFYSGLRFHSVFGVARPEKERSRPPIPC